MLNSEWVKYYGISGKAANIKYSGNFMVTVFCQKTTFLGSIKMPKQLLIKYS